MVTTTKPIGTTKQPWHAVSVVGQAEACPAAQGLRDKLVESAGGESPPADSTRLAEPIIGNLPRLLNVSLRDGDAAAWVRTSIQYSVAQSASQRPGSAMVLARLSEVLFAEAIRQHVETLPPEETGWLAALRDRYIGRTLALLHDKPAHPWTVNELARKVGLSRSALGQRFVALIGKPPMEYLMRWRVLLAARHLRESRTPVIQIAAEVGYESEAAFNRAFKRELGVPPAAWRRQAATA